MIKFTLARGGNPKPPFLVVQPGKGLHHLKGFTQAVAYLAQRWVVTGVIGGKITLLYPHYNSGKYAPRFHAAAVVRWVRWAVMHEAHRNLAVLPTRSVELWEGHKVAVPPFAVTARVLLLPETSQKEFREWWEGFVALHWPDRVGEALRQREALLRQSYWERWGDLPPKPEAEGPHFGTLEEHTGVYLSGLEAPTAQQLHDLRLRAEEIVERRWAALKEELYGAEAPEASPEAPDLHRCLFDAEYLAEQAAKVLRLAGLDFPVQFTVKGKGVGGVHPLWAILQGARIEDRWAALAARLETSNKTVLMAARRFQRLRNEGISFEEALEQSGCPFEAAQRLEVGDYYLLDNEEDVDVAEEPDPQKAALRATLEAWGMTLEEALALEGEAAEAFAASVRLAYEEFSE